MLDSNTDYVIDYQDASFYFTIINLYGCTDCLQNIYYREKTMGGTMVMETLWEGMCEFRWVSGLGNYNVSFWFQLAADPDQNVRSGSELLDRLLKVGANHFNVSCMLYYPPGVGTGEYWGFGVFLLQYFPLVSNKKYCIIIA